MMMELLVNVTITQEKCSNYLLCSQFINKAINRHYCKDCLFYFNYRMIFKNNAMESLTCPLCLYSPSLFVKQKNCTHYICTGCVYDIYFDKSYVKNMPKNPVHFLKRSWDLFIYSHQAYKFKRHIIDMFRNSDFNENDYRYDIIKYNFLVPIIFKKNIKSLIQYQLSKNKYISDYKDTQYNKIHMLKKCPYCRSCNSARIA